MGTTECASERDRGGFGEQAFETIVAVLFVIDDSLKCFANTK